MRGQKQAQAKVAVQAQGDGAADQPERAARTEMGDIGLGFDYFVV